MDVLKLITRLAIILFFPLLIGFGTYMFLSDVFFSALNPAATEKVIVEIAPGKTFGDISRDLRDRGVLRYAWSLSALARLKKVDTKIKAGEYEISASMTPREVLAKLMSGDILKRMVTLKEGQTMLDLAVALEEAGVIKKEAFVPSLTDPDLLAKAGLNVSSFEGYLFPETYLFSRPIDAAHIIWRMLEEGEKRWTTEFANRADELRMSRHEILILASIVEKESGLADEQPRIASVFHNRLSQGMKLQADPTVIYGIPNFNGNITKENLQNADNSYNTYMHFGLPPGPICNPSETAIHATLFPETTNYLFFVSDGNGRHLFSTTLQEHNENVARLVKRTTSNMQ